LGISWVRDSFILSRWFWVGSAQVSDRQKAHAMIRNLEFSASTLHSPEKWDAIKMELIIHHTSVSKYGFSGASRLANTSMSCTGRAMCSNPTGKNEAFSWPKAEAFIITKKLLETISHLGYTCEHQ